MLPRINKIGLQKRTRIYRPLAFELFIIFLKNKLSNTFLVSCRSITKKKETKDTTTQIAIKSWNQNANRWPWKTFALKFKKNPQQRLIVWQFVWFDPVKGRNLDILLITFNFFSFLVWTQRETTKMVSGILAIIKLCNPWHLTMLSFKKLSNVFWRHTLICPKAKNQELLSDKWFHFGTKGLVHKIIWSQKRKKFLLTFVNHLSGRNLRKKDDFEKSKNQKGIEK